VPIPEWKIQLVPASFRGVVFHVDVGGRASGRRTVLHEFPKRDTPYAEDMGRMARKFPITGYVIGPDFRERRDDLIFALENPTPGELVLPTGLQGGVYTVVPTAYGVREQRQQGGMAQFDMAFVEAGEAAFDALPDTQNRTNDAADNLDSAAQSSSQNQLGAPKGEVTVGPIEIGPGTP